MYDDGLVQTMIFQLYVWVYVLHMATYGRVGNEIEATPGGGLSLYIGVSHVLLAYSQHSLLLIC